MQAIPCWSIFAVLYEGKNLYTIFITGIGHTNFTHTANGWVIVQ